MSLWLQINFETFDSLLNSCGLNAPSILMRACYYDSVFLNVAKLNLTVWKGLAQRKYNGIPKIKSCAANEAWNGQMLRGFGVFCLMSYPWKEICLVKGGKNYSIS